MTHTPNPEVQALAAEAARKIKAVTDQSSAQIQSIYREYRAKANAITGTSDSLSSSADSQPHPQSIKH